MNTSAQKMLPVLSLLALLFTGCGGKTTGGSNLAIPGVDGPKIALIQDTVLITMVFSGLQLDGGLRYNIPKYPKSYIELSPDLQSNGTLLAMNLSLDDVLIICCILLLY